MSVFLLSGKWGPKVIKSSSQSSKEGFQQKIKTVSITIKGTM